MNHETSPSNPRRRHALVGAAAAAAVVPMAGAATKSAAGHAGAPAGTIATRDGVTLYYKDWGPRNGQPVVFSHGWPLSSDSWESQMMFLASQGYRCHRP